MQSAVRWTTTSLVVLTLVIPARVGSFATPSTPSARRRPGPPGAVEARRPGRAFPRRLRPPDDPAQVERGKQVYGIACRSCHGPDLRGGDMGGPNLLRSDGHVERRERRTPPPDHQGQPRGCRDARDRAEPKPTRRPLPAMCTACSPPHARRALPRPATCRPERSRRRRRRRGIYFKEKCVSCHSASGDLAGHRLAGCPTLCNCRTSGSPADATNATTRRESARPS